MNRYQRKVSREIKDYMRYYKIDKSEYSIIKWVLKNFSITGKERPCNDCINIMCEKNKNKLIWCKDRL